MLKFYIPTLNPELAETIKASIEHLQVPCDALLLQALVDIERQILAQRLSLEHELEKTQTDALAAISRILLSRDDLIKKEDRHYFKPQSQE